MNNTFGFIGTGNMGGALAKAAARVIDPQSLLLANKTHAKAETLAAQLGARAVSVAEAAGCSYIFLGVKPQMMADLLAEIAPILAHRTDSFVLVTMAAGLTMAQIRRMAGGEYPVIRIMPNTPVAVGKGLIFYCMGKNATEEDLDGLIALMGCCGAFEQLDERLFGAGSAVAGCGPAFTAIFIDALADGGVKAGLPRAKAIRFAEQMVLGSAQLALDTGKHPAQLRDEVASPGGATIEGIQALEEGGLRAAVINAVVEAWKKH